LGAYALPERHQRAGLLHRLADRAGDGELIVCASASIAAIAAWFGALCLLARRGLPKRLRKDTHELIIAPSREHSRKPIEARTRIEQYADGPRLEMFAREAASGWTAWGNQINKFAAPAASSKST
jgi:hypothetical protein